MFAEYTPSEGTWGLYPQTNGTGTLGRADLYWKKAYLDDITVSNTVLTGTTALHSAYSGMKGFYSSLDTDTMFVGMNDITGSDTAEAIIGYGDNGTENLVFYSQTGTTLTERMRLDGSGNLEVSSNVTADDFLLTDGTSIVPAGLISMWSGDPLNLPTGWALCDGQNGRPDLSGKFVVGYGSGDYATVGNTGGADSKSLIASNMPSHNHGGSALSAGSHNHWMDQTPDGNHDNNNAGNNEEMRLVADSGSDDSNIATPWSTSNHGKYTTSNGMHTHTIPSEGSGTAFDNRPAYYTIAYIIKL